MNPTDEPKKILILYADAGFGHRSAANAIAAALELTYKDRVKVTTLNPLDDKRVPFFLRDSQQDYDKMVRNTPELYRFGYDASDATFPSALFESSLTVILYEVMRDLIRAYSPDVIITTYPMYQAPLAAVSTINRVYIPLITVVTDLVSVHRIWFHPKVNACLVSTTLVRDLALAYGLHPDQVRVTGIPVHPDTLLDQRSKTEMRQALGWRTDMTTVLAVGSRRVDRLLDTLQVLNHFGVPLQLAVVAGADHELFARLQATDWHIPVHLYEYVSNMPALMRASDCLICKAGGLIVTEGLAASLPMMIIDVIPGQETGNADYVVQGGAADMAMTTMEVLEVMSDWLRNDQRLLKQRCENAQKLGRPRAALDVADFAFKAAERGPVSLSGRHITGRPRLVELLDRNHVPWQEHGYRRRKRNES
jgi:1,2-diacylglycerol 3-beta-galactosyltransferase